MIEIVVSWAKESLRLGNIAFIVAILAIGVLLLFLRPRWGRRWIVAFVVMYWFVSSPFGSRLFTAPLVRGFHSIEDPREAGSAGAIVVLGAGMRAMRARSVALAYPSEGTTLRVLEATRVFRLLDSRPLVVASGGVTSPGLGVSEAAVIAEELAKLNVPADHVVVEDASFTTHDQAIYVTRLLNSRGIGRFVLVTSPTHMARSVAAFRAQHADVVPSVSAQMPERPRIPLPFMPNGDALDLSDAAVYDYAGLVYYWARGWLRAAPAETGR